jgi:hypothetical protein
MRSEQKAISEHHEGRVDNIQDEVFVQILSLTGITIAFGIALVRTVQMIRKSKNRIQNLN